MAVLSSDSFTRADSANLGPNWTTRTGGVGGEMFKIVSNQAVPSSFTDGSEFLDSVVWPNDHYSQAALFNLFGTGNQTGVGVAVRVRADNLNSGSGFNDLYGCVVNTAATNNVTVHKWVAGVYTMLAQRTQAWTNGDVLRMEVQGSTIRIYRNGVQMGANITDGSLTGYLCAAGLASIGTYTNGIVDTWEGGDIGVASTAPSAPQALQATGSNAQVALVWVLPNTDGGSAITGYQIYRSTSPGAETLLASPAGTGLTYTDSTAVNGTLYYYKVAAVNAVGTSALSNEATATPAVGGTPAPPQTLQATGGVAQISLSWVAPPIYPSNTLLPSNTNTSVTSYKIYRGLTTNSETLLASPAGTGVAYVDSTAVAGTTYFYKVTAVNANGEGSTSNESSATATAANTAPSAPLSLAATAGDAQVALSWSVPASDGGSAITAYKIYRSLSSGTETLLASPAGTATAYIDSTSANGTLYFYKVSAVNAVGESALSNEDSATPSAVVTPQPARTYRRFYGPNQFSNVAAILYTCPASTTAVIRHIHASNPSGSPVDITLSIGTPAAATDLWDGIPIDPNDILDHYQDFTLVAGETIQGFASVSATLNVTIDGYELT